MNTYLDTNFLIHYIKNICDFIRKIVRCNILNVGVKLSYRPNKVQLIDNLID